MPRIPSLAPNQVTKIFFSFLKKLANGINEFTKLGVTANCATERK